MTIVVPSLPSPSFKTTSCPYCRCKLEYLLPPQSSDDIKIRCCNQPSCGRVFDPPKDEPTRPDSSQSDRSTAKGKGNGDGASGSGRKWGGLGGGAPGKKRIGTDDKPIDLTYYEVLNVSPKATTDEIKSSYRRLAIKLHPDKNLGNPEAEEKFKMIAVAYQTLSDPVSRKRYNEFGPKGSEVEEGMVDPEAVFSSLFGGERFQDIIGTISLGQDMKTALQQEEDEEEEEDKDKDKKDPESALVSTDPAAAFQQVQAQKQQDEAKTLRIEERKKRKLEKQKKVDEERAERRKERVEHLKAKLKKKLEIYTEQVGSMDTQGNLTDADKERLEEDVAKSVRAIWTIEAEELKGESYGLELLHVVGFTYSSKSRHFLASTGPIPFGLGGWFHSAKSTAHVFSETVSTLRSAYELKDIFESLATAEKDGNLSEEKKRELEEKAAQKGLQALFKGAKLEVESVIREVCDQLLAEKIPKDALRRRAVALGILGSVYEAVRSDQSNEEEYVKIEPRGQSQQHTYQEYKRTSNPHG